MYYLLTYFYLLTIICVEFVTMIIIINDMSLVFRYVLIDSFMLHCAPVDLFTAWHIHDPAMRQLGRGVSIHSSERSVRG